MSGLFFFVRDPAAARRRKYPHWAIRLAPTVLEQIGAIHRIEYLLNQSAHIVLATARMLIACVGFLLIYIAAFLHEDEEGKLQNRLEELWVRVDDFQRQALSKQTVFLLLRLLRSGFDTLLGSRLVSARSATVVFCYSWASAVFLNSICRKSPDGGLSGE